MLLPALHLFLVVQAVQATVVGVVRDQETGEPLTGAIVALPDLARVTTTDAAGRYLLAGVPAGPQHIVVRFIGHTGRTLHALVPSAGRLEIGVSLAAEPLRLRTIEVRPAVSLGGVEPGDSTDLADRSLSIAAVRNDPRLAEADAFQALGGGEVVLRAETPSGVHLHGGGSDQTGYLLDGVPVFSPYHAAGTFSAWNPDALSRVRLTSSLPSPGDPDALGGTVAAATLSPGTRLRTQGSLSTTQARLTLDGPIGVPGGGFLVSVRSGFPGVPSPQNDPTYLRAESGDWMAKGELPALGGRLRLLAYGSENEIGAAAVAANPDSRRNRFNWWSASRGVEWSGIMGDLSLQVSGWSAATGAESVWSGATAAELSSERHDLGLRLSAERRSRGGTTLAGIRLERSRTSYALTADSAPAALESATPVVTGFVQRSRRLDRRTEVTVGVTAGAGQGLRVGPAARLRWGPAPGLALTGNYSRTHQFAQSLRNAESVVGNVFPADLFVGAGASGVPVARSDLGVIGAEYRPAPGMRVGVEAWRRGAGGIVAVAPRAAGPFSTGEFVAGSLRATGLTVEVAASTARLGVMAGYTLQRVRIAWADSAYIPGHGASHRLEGGVIVFPTATTSIRLGAAAELGRRGTLARGALEWEACNLSDRGCEFGGSPEIGGERLGATGLPAYVRLDLGVRKHWHLDLAGRDATVAVFGTLTNLLDRRNVLTYTVDPVSGARTAVQMRPLAPLLVGLDWRF